MAWTAWCGDSVRGENIQMKETIPNPKSLELGIQLHSKFHSIVFHCGCHKLVYDINIFKFRSNSMVGGIMVESRFTL